MTIEETFRKLLRDKYADLCVSVRKKSIKHRVYPDSIRNYYEDYYQALEDALCALVGKRSAKNFKEYYCELESALVSEAKQLQYEYDLRSAREHMKTSYGGPLMDKLLQVISDDDLLALEKESNYSHPDMWVDFLDYLADMRKKYRIA